MRAFLDMFWSSFLNDVSYEESDRPSLEELALDWSSSSKHGLKSRVTMH